MPNMRKFILYFVSLLVVVAISFYVINRNVENFTNYDGEESEKNKTKQDFLKELSIRESLTEEFIHSISTGFDKKLGEYFVKVSYKDESSVVYVYRKNTSLNSFYLSDIMVNDQKITDSRVKYELVNQDRLNLNAGHSDF